MAGGNNYGTVSQETHTQNGTADAGDEETAALLGNGKPKTGSYGKRFRKHMTVNVSNSWGDIALLGSYIITGLLDSCAVFIWGSFLSMQTGKATSRILRCPFKHSFSLQETPSTWALVSPPRPNQIAGSAREPR